MDMVSVEQAFPRLSRDELDVIREAGSRCRYADGEVVFRMGEADIDFFVVESGAIEVVNPVPVAGGEAGSGEVGEEGRGGRHVTMHGPGEFTGDIDLLTRRPVVVTGIARGETELVRVKGSELRRLLGTVPKLGEKLLLAFSIRRELLEDAGVVGMRVVGPAHCPQTTEVREFLYKNFVPYIWYDPATQPGKKVAGDLARAVGQEAVKYPAIECSPGVVLVRPTLKGLAKCAGIVRPCPQKVHDLAIVGAGPAGMAAAVYAASEGLSTVVLDRLGPGGQAGGSSMIENFIGFPWGLSGNDLATRGVLQMLKFGALLLAPVSVTGLVPGEGDEPHTITTDDVDVRARTVLVATGAKWKRLPARGARRFERNGIFYSATSVEQRLCTSRPVVVVGAGNSGGQAAMFLSECSPKVYFLIHGGELGPGMSSYLVERIRASERIETLLSAEVTDVYSPADDRDGPAPEDTVPTSGAKVAAVRVRTGGQERVLEAAAVFVFIGAEPNAGFLPPEVERDERGYLLTGEQLLKSGKWRLERTPCPLETSVPRVLAAGDVRCGSTKRVGFAVGDGSLAVTCVHRLR